ncbi:rod-binding protein [Vibrio sp. 10N]|uniref:rod-binding protein n=1 Tax=Vibrio sp. 10N TaxID=3058938 RepID=UPI00281354B3|nr:rod-binding protein [Vibrio sp. 10N]
MKIDAMNDTTRVNSMLYHDNAALTNIKHSNDSPEALKEVAGQFEAMFLQMVLRQMRSSSDALADEDSPFASQQHGVFRDMHDGQLSIELAKKQNSGIADMLVKQLGPAQPNQSNREVQFDAARVQTLSAANDLEAKSQTHTASVTNGVSTVNEANDAAAFNHQSPSEAAMTMAFSQPLMKITER